MKIRISDIIGAVALFAITATAAQAEEENQCHWMGMLAARVVELRESNVSLLTILEASASSSDRAKMSIAQVYAMTSLNQGDAYVVMSKACEIEKAKQ